MADNAEDIPNDSLVTTERMTTTSERSPSPLLDFEDYEKIEVASTLDSILTEVTAITRDMADNTGESFEVIPNDSLVTTERMTTTSERSPSPLLDFEDYEEIEVVSTQDSILTQVTATTPDIADNTGERFEVIPKDPVDTTEEIITITSDHPPSPLRDFEIHEEIEVASTKQDCNDCILTDATGNTRDMVDNAGEYVRVNPFDPVDTTEVIITSASDHPPSPSLDVVEDYKDTGIADRQLPPAVLNLGTDVNQDDRHDVQDLAPATSPVKRGGKVKYSKRKGRILLPLSCRPRRVIFNPKIQLNENEKVHHGLNLPQFRGMGTHDILQKMADRGNILHINGTLRWVGATTGSTPTTTPGTPTGEETWTSVTAEEGDEYEEEVDAHEDEDEEDDMTVGGPLEIYAPMKISSSTAPRFRYRKKNKTGKVDPLINVPNSGSGSLIRSTEEDSGSDLGNDEAEDDGYMQNQGWSVEGEESASKVPIQQDYEFIDDPEWIKAREPPPKRRKQNYEPQTLTGGKIYPKPSLSFSILVAMSLKNSTLGRLPVSEIYKFICYHFPYFLTAKKGWKNSVRHNLSLNKWFEKIEKPGCPAQKGCLWTLDSTRIQKMEEEVQKWLRKDLASLHRAMSDPENLDLMQRGELKLDYSNTGNAASASDEEEEDKSLLPMEGQTPAANTDQISTLVVDGDMITNSTPVTILQTQEPQEQQHLVVKLKEDGEQGLAADVQAIDLAQLRTAHGHHLLFHPDGTFTISFTGHTN